MIYVLLVDGFEEIEALTPVDILRRCEAEVKTVGVNEEYVTGSHNITVKTDILMAEVKKEDMTCLIIPGGPGYKNIEASKEAMDLIGYAKENKILLCAICAAPSIIGKLGYLDGKKATCFPGFEGEMTGAVITGEKAVFDEHFITGKGAGAASEFGFLIAEKMTSKEMSDKIRSSMQY